ncbi:hypothetical protein [Thiobaca trueperi]|uniref:hypothetical protein n=1 Tax=Thiobaca trueperi TaxID=127458 RepID=UPI0010502585|nr:hypothetical protein [Thiobaca trueperi]
MTVDVAAVENDGTFDFDLSGWEMDDALPVLNKVMALPEASNTHSAWRSQEVGFLSGASAAEHMIAWV